MTTEKSHGKARTTLPRSSDLGTVEAGAKPSQGRSAGGHFAAGNRIGVGARWKHSVAKLLGKRSGGDAEAELVAADAFRVFLATLRSLPSDAAPVRSLVALHARHVALAAYFGAKAEAAGLATETGLELDEVASKHSQRAERLLISAIDVAKALSSKAGTPSADVAALMEAAEADAERRREEERRRALPPPVEGEATTP